MTTISTTYRVNIEPRQKSEHALINHNCMLSKKNSSNFSTLRIANIKIKKIDRKRSVNWTFRVCNFFNATITNKKWKCGVFSNAVKCKSTKNEINQITHFRGIIIISTCLWNIMKIFFPTSVINRKMAIKSNY